MPAILDRRHERFWRTAPWAIAAALLLLPLVAMQFTDEVAWGPADFAVAGALLFGACAAFEAAARSTGALAYRIAVAIALLAALLLVWINLAVGIIDSEDNPANLLFAAVLAVALVGTLLARFRPRAMAGALAATAAAQASAALIALAAGWTATGTNGPAPLIVLTGVFVGLWLVSAWLFWRAA